ncbi:conserved hypothetical protein [Thiolapillus brandeum]|uniref:Uncharacterized protein n=1 Tax=Thiolapillus brandeum TaxID=1076588 RepID=A0A7U6JH08_9GAMM|nr:conserved hypothetical protein [Thiolapillus brandeum]
MQCLPLQLVLEGVFFLFSGFSFFSGLGPWGWCKCCVLFLRVHWWRLVAGWVVFLWWLRGGVGRWVLRLRPVLVAGGCGSLAGRSPVWCWWSASLPAGRRLALLQHGAAGAAVRWRFGVAGQVSRWCGRCPCRCCFPVKLKRFLSVAVLSGGLPVARVVGVVAVAGSRQLPPGGTALVGRIVGSLVRSGSSLVVGCATGADAVVLSSAPAAQVQCLAAFGPGGAGACRVSAVSQVVAHAAAGGQVQWWAGGGASLPIAVRLSHRTQAVVGAASSGLVAFLSSPSSRGSLLACRAAAARGLPVVVFPLGFGGLSLPALGAGQWVPCDRGGIWSAAWQWQAEKGLF